MMVSELCHPPAPSPPPRFGKYCIHLSRILSNQHLQFSFCLRCCLWPLSAFLLSLQSASPLLDLAIPPPLHSSPHSYFLHFGIQNFALYCLALLSLSLYFVTCAFHAFRGSLSFQLISEFSAASSSCVDLVARFHSMTCTVSASTSISTLNSLSLT